MYEELKDTVKETYEDLKDTLKEIYEDEFKEAIDSLIKEVDNILNFLDECLNS